jgi:hypothetical protein
LVSPEEIRKVVEEVKEPKAHVFFRLSLITRHIGEVHSDIIGIYRIPSEAQAHRANLKISLADLFMQLSILCLELGEDEDELRRFAIRRYRERTADFRERGWVEVT